MIVVDRIEGDMAVLEIGGKCVDVPLAALPEGLREGDLLEIRKAPASAAGEAMGALARLKKRFPQGPDTIDL